MRGFFARFGKMLLAFSLLPLLTSFSQAQSQPIERWCAQNSEYSAVHRSNINDLRTALVILSELGKIKVLAADSAELYRDITDASVFSLANVLSLRSDFIQGCSRNAEAYHQEMAANERFMFLFDLAVSDKANLVRTALEKIEKRHPGLFAPDGRGSAGITMPFNKTITQRLKKWESHGKDPKKDPLAIAASALLGRKVELDEHAIKPAETFKIDSEFASLAYGSLDDAFSWINNEPLPSKLKTLSRFFLIK